MNVYEEAHSLAKAIKESEEYKQYEQSKKLVEDVYKRQEEANALYRKVIELIQAEDIHVEEGIFRADMMVEIHNDGPVTILLDSNKNF